MKAALIGLTVISVALAGLSGLMLSKADSSGQVALWSILLVVNMLNVIRAGSALGKMG